jgi:hypothetical protein
MAMKRYVISLRFLENLSMNCEFGEEGVGVVNEDVIEVS